MDYDIETNHGEKYLELMEVVNIKNKENYKKASTSYEIIEYCDNIWKNITKKSNKYTGVRKPIVLLIYCTEDKFSLGLGAIDYLRSLANANKHVFEYIFYMLPNDPSCATLKQIFPSDVNDFDKKDIQDLHVASIPLSKCTVKFSKKKQILEKGD